MTTGLLVSIPFGVGFLLVFWLPAYAIDCFVMLSGNDRETLRQDAFKLIFSGHAILFMFIIYYAQKFVALHESLIRGLAGK